MTQIAKIDRTPHPVRITFDGLGTVEPTEDITPLEAVRLSMMLACGVIGSHVDYVGFAQQHGLTRHFKPS